MNTPSADYDSAALTLSYTGEEKAKFEKRKAKSGNGEADELASSAPRLKSKSGKRRKGPKPRKVMERR